MWREVMIGLAGALLFSWLALIVALVIIRPKGNLLRESLRILPDLVRLLKNVSTDPALPAGVRVRVGLLMIYLALPFDLIPDFIPVLGYADDAIVAVAVLRSVVRRVGLESLREHWCGTPDGFTALCRLAGLQSEPA
ncbi:MAG: YkvA family protein [Propionicimonas sp.]